MAVAQLEHVQLAISRLLWQFQGDHQPNFQAVASAFARQLNELETAFAALQDLTIDTETGAQLDGDGTIVGEVRAGRTDADYRAAIKARIQINRGNGRPEDVLFAVGAALPDGYQLQLSEPGSAYVVVDVRSALLGTDPPASELARVLDAALGAGVAHALIYSSEAPDDTFAFAAGDTPDATVPGGYANDGGTIGGVFAGVAV